MTDSKHLLDEAWELAVLDQGKQALDRLGCDCPPAHICGDLEAAKLATIFIRAGETELGWRYLQRDWGEAPAAAAGLAGAMGLALGMPQWAEPLLRQASANDLFDVTHVVNLGRCLICLNRAEEAVELLGQLDGSEVASERVFDWLECLVDARVAAGQVEAALALIPVECEEPRSRVMRAHLLAYLGLHDQAFAELKLALQERPQQLELLLATADLAEALGRHHVSTSALEAALNADPQRLEVWIRLVHACCVSRRDAQAEEALAQVKVLVQGQSAGSRASALAAEARLASAQNRLQEAKAFYQKALKLSPLLLPALSGLGNLCLQLGHIEEAIEQFETICSIAPLCGWTHLIQAHQPLGDSVVVHALEQAAELPTLEGPINSGLLFCLAAHYDKSRDDDKAFAAAKRANEASKHLLNYSPIAHRQQVETSIRYFDSAFFRDRRSWGSDSQVPVFIVGLPRSGTTLTEQILASHPQVFGAGELGQIPELISRIELWERKLGSPMRYPLCLNELDSASTRLYADHLLASLRALASAGKTFVIDKLPHNFENIGLIRLLFPRCKIIRVQRDPLDVAVSNYFTDYAAKQGGMGFAYDLRWIAEQIQDEQRLMGHWHSVFPGEILDVCYEDLIANPLSEVQRLLDFLGLQWDESVMAFQTLDRPVKTASLWQVRQPIYSTSKGRWRRYEEQLKPLQAVLASPLPGLAIAAAPPLPPPGSFHAGMRCLRKGQLHAANAHFSVLLEHCPSHAEAEHFRGVALLKLGRPHQALQAIKRSLRHCPDYKPWLTNLAVAETAVRSASDSDPN